MTTPPQTEKLREIIEKIIWDTHSGFACYCEEDPDCVDEKVNQLLKLFEEEFLKLVGEDVGEPPRNYEQALMNTLRQQLRKAVSERVKEGGE